MSLMAANEESDPSVILNGFWVTLDFLGCMLFDCVGAEIVKFVEPY